MGPSSTLVRSRSGPGWLLRESRTRLGLDRSQVAQLLVVGRADVERFESGTLAPDELVRQRISAFGELDGATAYRATDYLTIPALAAGIRRRLLDGGTVHDILQLLIQASDDFSALAESTDLAFFLTEPSTTGDRHHDALLAGLAVHLCRRAGVRMTPAWTRADSRYLDSFWWFGLDDEPSTLRAYNYQRTPSCLRARGVIFNAENLDSV